MFNRITLLTLLSLSLLGMIVSCSINETEEPDQGLLYITATDIINNQPIEGAIVFLNGVQNNSVTPALISNLEVGDYQVTLRPPAGWSSRTETLTVMAFDTTSYDFAYGTRDTSAVNNQVVIVEANQNSVTYILDDQLQETFDDSIKFILAPDSVNSYAISVFKNGYKTLLPSLYSLTAVAAQSANLTFELEAVNIGHAIGNLAPDFKLPNFINLETGWTDSLSLGQYRGRVTLVNFWFATCNPCKAEFPHFEVAYSERYADGFRILAVNTGWANENPEDFIEFRDQYSFPLLKNGDRVLEKYGLNVNTFAPQNFLVDKTGIIRYQMGETNIDDLNAILNELLAE